jgi:hypothetical protein
MDLYLVCPDGATFSATGPLTQWCLNAEGTYAWTVVEAPQSSLLPPLSVQDGAELAGAMVLTWAIAWGIRQVLNMLGSK